MNTVGGRHESGTGGRRVTSLVHIVQSDDGAFDAGRAERVQDGREANAVLARAEQAGSRFLVAVSPEANGTIIADPAKVALSAMAGLQQSSGDLSGGLSADDVDLLGLAVVTDPIDFGDDSAVAIVAPLVVGVAPLVHVGGFDPDEPGLGWIDLVDRLACGGFVLSGLDRQALPFAPILTASLEPSDRLEQEGRWFRKRGVGPVARLRLGFHRRRILTTAPRVDALKRTELAARRRWRGRRPDQAQHGIGNRADWRQLIDQPGSNGAVSAALVGMGPTDDWQWLVDDGWARSITTSLPATNGPTSEAPVFDVVVIGACAMRADQSVVERAAASVSDQGSIVVMVEPVRRPRGQPGHRSAVLGHRSAVKVLRRSGMSEIRRFLTLPDLDAPKRYIPLDHPGGPAWLAGPVPALAQARLPRGRRLLRQVIKHLAPRAPELLGGVVVVASTTQRAGGRPVGGGEASIVITSGFDEGSRTVVLPLALHGRPDRVVKITARPSYRENAEREHRLLIELSSRVEPAGLVPTPLNKVDDGELHAVVESYAGRWTVADVLNEQRRLEARAGLLDVALDAITDLAGTDLASSNLARTEPQTETWSEDGFDELISRWFDRLDELQGPSPVLAALRRSLAERSRELEGLALPMGVRHFDLGPWNMVIADLLKGRAIEPGRSPITVVDWELAPPRNVANGPVGADHLYFTKYWLHIAAGCQSIEAEQSAFAFLAGSATLHPQSASQSTLETARVVARKGVNRSFVDLGLPVGFLPLLEAHVWAEAACYTSERRMARGGDGGSPARYLETVARHRSALLDAWPC